MMNEPQQAERQADRTMPDDDLEELARLAVSARRKLVGYLLAIVLGTAGMSIAIYAELPVELAVAAPIAAIAASFAIALKIRTPPGAFPTLRALRDRPGEVAHVVEISRGSHFIALVGRDGKFIAKPLKLKGELATNRRMARAAVHAAQAEAERALALVAARCPLARTARIRDGFGATSLRKLAARAIEQAGPSR